VVCVGADDGALHHSETDFRSWNRGLEHDFLIRACQLGGDVVVKAGVCTIASPMSRGGIPGVLYNIYRDES
jgi:hypothetical protein